MAQQQSMNAVFYATTYHPIQAGSIDGTDTASHDNGVYRALVASSTGLYDPTGDPKAEGNPYTTLFVGRLAHHTTEKTLHELESLPARNILRHEKAEQFDPGAMSKYGRVKHLRLVRHIGASRGYAFVEFETENDMQYAYEVAQDHIIDGSPILVDYNRQQLMPGWIPRRLGGGLGGRKESGQLRFGGRDRPFRAPLRTIPSEQLIKLGIPLPPVGRYMSRFQLPPMPHRPGSLNEGLHYKQQSFYKQSSSQELLAKTLGNDERLDIEHRAEFSEFSPRQRPAVAVRGSSPPKELRTRQTAAGDAEKTLSDKGNRGHEDENQHKRRRQSEHRDENVDRQKMARSGQEDRGSRRHHKRSSSRSGHKDTDSGHHERSTSRSGHKGVDGGHHDRSTSRSGHKDIGYLHRRNRETRERSAEYNKSPKHGLEESKQTRERSTEYDRSSTHGREETRQTRERSAEYDRSSTHGREESRQTRERSAEYDRSSTHGREESRQTRERSAEYDRSSTHGREESRRSRSSHRRRDD